MSSLRVHKIMDAVKISLVFIAMLLAVSVNTLQSEASTKTVTLIIDGVNVSFSAEDGYGVPFIDPANRTQVPVRKPVETIGAQISYDQATRTVHIQKDDTKIQLTIDGAMYVNGEAYLIDSPAMIVDNRTYMPIRHVFTALGYNVQWDQETYTIQINKNSSSVETVPGWSAPSYRANPLSTISGDLGLVTGYINGTVDSNNPWQLNDMYIANVTLHNQSDKTITVTESLELKFQIKKDGVLVFEKSFSPFKGSIPPNSSVSNDTPISYWNTETLTPGSYEAILVFPTNFTFRYEGSSTTTKLNIRENMYDEITKFTIE